jgi:hypothetical protein
VEWPENGDAGVEHDAQYDTLCILRVRQVRSATHVPGSEVVMMQVRSSLRISDRHLSLLPSCIPTCSSLPVP